MEYQPNCENNQRYWTQNYNQNVDTNGGSFSQTFKQMHINDVPFDPLSMDFDPFDQFYDIPTDSVPSMNEMQRDEFNYGQNVPSVDPNAMISGGITEQAPIVEQLPFFQQEYNVFQGPGNHMQQPYQQNGYEESQDNFSQESFPGGYQEPQDIVEQFVDMALEMPMQGQQQLEEQIPLPPAPSHKVEAPRRYNTRKPTQGGKVQKLAKPAPKRGNRSANKENAAQRANDEEIKEKRKAAVRKCRQNMKNFLQNAPNEIAFKEGKQRQLDNKLQRARYLVSQLQQIHDRIQVVPTGPHMY